MVRRCMLSSVQTEWHLSGKNHIATSNKFPDINTCAGSRRMLWIALLRICTVNKSCKDLQRLNLSRSHSAQGRRWSTTIKSVQPWTRGKECISLECYPDIYSTHPHPVSSHSPINLRPLFIPSFIPGFTVGGEQFVLCWISHHWLLDKYKVQLSCIEFAFSLTLSALFVFVLRWSQMRNHMHILCQTSVLVWTGTSVHKL